jgi:NAD(P)-dependent dehydrogenase (short-subunit alcohol dehydrogenase family)
MVNRATHSRIAVVTGAGSGIGRATKELLEARGETVIGVDLRGADIDADLAVPEGRDTLAREVAARTDGHVDAVYAVAGTSDPTPRTGAVNYFGMVATLTSLRPLLARSRAPRAVAVSSMAAVYPVDDDLLAAMLADDEPTATRRAEQLVAEERGHLIYTTSKRAISRWVRRQAPTAEWAGASIALNAIAPGVVATPMSAPFTTTEKSKAGLLRQFPMPLNGIAPPEAVAEVLAWLGSVPNTHLCGQILYIDGGGDAVVRGDTAW